MAENIIEFPKAPTDERALFDGKRLLQVLRESLPDVTGIRTEFGDSGELVSIHVCARQSADS
jgi:hypothetical protein